MADVVRFDQTPLTRFYMCRSCRNHLLPRSNRIYKDKTFRAIVCRPVVNVRLGKNLQAMRLFGRYELDVARVSCNRCKSYLGMQFVRVQEPNRVVQEGRFLLFERKLVYWNGNQVVSARSRRPID